MRTPPIEWRSCKPARFSQSPGKGGPHEISALVSNHRSCHDQFLWRGRRRNHAHRPRRHSGRGGADDPGLRKEDRPQGEGDLRLRQRHQGAGHQGRRLRRAHRAAALSRSAGLGQCGRQHRDAARPCRGRRRRAARHAPSRHLHGRSGEEAVPVGEVDLLSRSGGRRGRGRQHGRDAEKARHRRSDEAQDQARPGAARAR